MAAIKPRNDPVRLFWRRLLTLGVLILVLFGLWAVADIYMKERESSDLREQSEAQLNDLETRQDALNARIAALQTERGQEAALRDAYQVGKPGEGAITIVDKPASTSPVYGEDKRSWWQKIFWWW